MKVYVCYRSYPYEGCSSPEAAFKEEEHAKAWAKANKVDYEDANYEELELE